MLRDARELDDGHASSATSASSAAAPPASRSRALRRRAHRGLPARERRARVRGARSRTSTRARTSACPISTSTSAGCASSAARPTTGPGAAGRSTSSTSRRAPGCRCRGWPIARADLEPFYRAGAGALPARRLRLHARALARPGPGGPAVRPREAREPGLAVQPADAVRRGLPRRARGGPQRRRPAARERGRDRGERGRRRGPERPVRDARRQAARVRARAYVLACGGLENPRLLLAATVTPASAISATWSAAASWSTRT